MRLIKFFLFLIISFFLTLPLAATNSSVPVSFDITQFPPESTSADQTFDVSVCLVDSANNIVTCDSSTVVSLTSDGILLGNLTEISTGGCVTFSGIQQIIAGSRNLFFSSSFGFLSISHSITADATQLISLLPGQFAIQGQSPSIGQTAGTTSDQTETVAFEVRIQAVDNFYNLDSMFSGTLVAASLGPGDSTLPPTAGITNQTFSSGMISADLIGVTDDQVFVTLDTTGLTGITGNNSLGFRILEGLRITQLCIDDIDKNGDTDSVTVSFDGPVDDSTIMFDSGSPPRVKGFYLSHDGTPAIQATDFNSFGVLNDNMIELRFEDPQEPGTTTKDLTYYVTLGQVKSTTGAFLLDFLTFDNTTINRINKQEGVLTSDTVATADNGTSLTAVTVDFSGPVPEDLSDPDRWVVVADNGAVLNVTGIGIDGVNNQVTVSLDGTLGNLGQPKTGFVDPNPNFVVTGVLAEPGSSASGGLAINLSWDDLFDPNLELYLILRSTSLAGPWTLIGETTDTDFEDSNINAGTTYFYQIRALLNGGVITQPSEIAFIALQGSPPTAAIEASPIAGTAPLTVGFGGAGVDPDGSIVSFAIDFNTDDEFEVDFFSLVSPNSTFVYLEPGTFTAKLTVQDNDGNIGCSTINITVTAPIDGPTANATLSVDGGPAPLTVTFNDASTPGISEIAFWEWDYTSDGIFDFSSTLTGDTVNTYGIPNQNTNAKLRVTDTEGRVSVKSFPITIGAGTNPPQVTLDAAQATGADGDPISAMGEIPYCVTFDVSTFDASGGSIIKFEYDFDGDGLVDLNVTADTGVVTHCFTEPGIFSPSIIVCDNDNLLAKDTTFLVVQPPTNVNVFLVDPVSQDNVGGDQLQLRAKTIPNALTETVFFESSTDGVVWTQVGDTQFGALGNYIETLSLSGFADGATILLRAQATDTNNNADTSPIVQVNKVANNLAEVFETVSGGKVTKQVSFDPTVSQDIKASSGAGIEIPLGAISDDAISIGGLKVVIEEKGQDGPGFTVTSGLPTNADGSQTVQNVGLTQSFDLSLSNGDIIQVPGKSLTLTIPYPDPDNDGLVNGTNFAETQLQIFRFNESTNQWERVISSVVDAENNEIKATVAHLTDFGMFATIALNTLGPFPPGSTPPLICLLDGKWDVVWSLIVFMLFSCLALILILRAKKS